ncbi:MAG: hypothetical protein ISS74_06830 [Planctomycetes bacterium]|nr:hypothetical protein [Planctomycetota bacterium]
MTLTRSRKLCVAILGLALAALAVDRVFLASGTSGPKAAGASSLPAPDSADAAGASQDKKTLPAADRPPTLAARLESAAEQFALAPTEMRDGFSIAETWLAELQVPTAAHPPGPAEPQPSAAEAFAGRHTLTSVILTSQGGSAVIDGKVVPLGQAVDGFTLLRLTRESAVFGAAGEEVELRLRR